MNSVLCLSTHRQEDARLHCAASRDAAVPIAARTDPDTAPDTVAAADAKLDALFLANSLSIGGSERKIVRLVNRMSERGVRAGIAYLNGPETLVASLRPEVPRWHLHRRGKFSIAAARHLAGILEQTRCPTLFTVNMYPTLYAAVARRLVGSASLQLISLVNTTDFGPGQRWRQRFYKQVIARFDSVVYGCRAQRDLWESGDESAAMVIYNGVDTAEFNGDAPIEQVQALRTQLDLDENAFIVGSVGRLAQAKNHCVLIDAVASLRSQGLNARLVLVGDGELREALEHRAQSAGIEDAVSFTGALTDPRPALALMDVFVLPSLYVETFSNAALEAMAMSKAVVLSDVGGSAEMVRDGRDGRVVERQSLATQLPQILSMLAMSPELVAQFGAAARRRVEEMFSFEDMVTQYMKLIHGDARGIRHA